MKTFLLTFLSIKAVNCTKGLKFYKKTFPRARCVHGNAGLTETGVKITTAANEQLGFTHPTNPDWNHISFCQIALPLQYEDDTPVSRNSVVIEPGKLDRSPCGTGCSARLAVLYTRGILKTGDRMIGRSIIDSRFDCAIIEETRVGDKKAIIPSIRGRAWITGTHQVMLDPDDPWPGGYRLTDTWPGSSKLRR